MGGQRCLCTVLRLPAGQGRRSSRDGVLSARAFVSRRTWRGKYGRWTQVRCLGIDRMPPGALSRMELINLKLEMECAHKDKLSIRQTERALEMLEEQQWLVQVAPPVEVDCDDVVELEDKEKDENSDGNGEEERRPQRKRKKRPSSRGSSTGGGRRKSLKGTFYGVGPRSYMELGEFLQEAGLPGDRMPQSILHRI